MDRSLHQKIKKSAAVLIIDSMELRRAGVASFLTTWADDSNVQIVQTDPGEVSKRPIDPSVKLILLVVGAQGISESQSQNWIAALHEQYADTPLVFVSEREEPEEVVAAFKAGARGFIPMSVTPPVAMQAFTFIMSGGSYFPPTALIQHTHVASSMTVVKKETGVVADVRGLTARQQEVLERLRQGESNKLIGRQLKLRESTVKVHIRQIMRKLGATNRTQAALCAAQLTISARGKNDESDDDTADGGLVHVHKHVFHA
ncbi:MAG: response regulator transcription factor [Xanthobacteraceae bacterium]|nr:response regulator transcription factor [Xanthobacteraceae bacterium]